MSLFMFLLAIGISQPSQMTRIRSFINRPSINHKRHLLLITICISKMILVSPFRNQLKIIVKSATETTIFQYHMEMIKTIITEMRFIQKVSPIGQILTSFTPTKPMKKPTYSIRCSIKKFKML